ncbi:MAG: hypothetical protein JWQ02_2260 [Capsulimonas sp.]|nr:hypothetical protein [Capsulimonas sp.]
MPLLFIYLFEPLNNCFRHVSNLCHYPKDTLLKY